MNILLIGGPYDDVVVPADKDEDGMPADMITTMKETDLGILEGDTQPVTGEPEPMFTGVYVPAGITDEGNLAFMHHDPHPGCPRYKIPRG